MKLYIKNMVCSRCKLVVGQILDGFHVNVKSIELGEVSIENTGNMGDDLLESISSSLKEYGFELLEDKNSLLIEKVKKGVGEYLDLLSEEPDSKLSRYIQNKVFRDYRYISNLYSAIVGETIEHYFIKLRIEKVKELLIYNEQNITNIANQLGFSSSAHLSAQFKKHTGLTPSHFKKIRADKKRISINNL